jgi:hypothetical protein
MTASQGIRVFASFLLASIGAAYEGTKAPLEGGLGLAMPSAFFSSVLSMVY